MARRHGVWISGYGKSILGLLRWHRIDIACPGDSGLLAATLTHSLEGLAFNCEERAGVKPESDLIQVLYNDLGSVQLHA